MASESYGEHADKAAAAAFPAFDTSTYASQAFWLIISFSILYLILSRALLPKLGSVIEARKNKIVTDLDDAARMKADADEALAEMDKQLALARADARAKADKARADIDAKIAETSAAKTVELDARLAEAEARIDEMKQAAMANVSDIATSTTEAILSRLDVKPDATALKQTVTRSVEEVVS